MTIPFYVRVALSVLSVHWTCFNLLQYDGVIKRFPGLQTYGNRQIEFWQL